MTGRWGARLLMSARDPWVVLLSVFGGGVAWALGVSVPSSLVMTVTMLTTAATVGALTRTRGVRPVPLRPGTRQQALIHLLDGHVRSLRSLQTPSMPGVVRTKAEEALVAAGAARPYVLRVAAAVDALDDSSSAATVYAGLLELSATARTMGVCFDDTDVGSVNDSVTLLQMTFVELQADAAKLPVDGLT